MKTQSPSLRPHKSFNLNRLLTYALFLIPLGVAGNILFSLLKTDKEIFCSLKSFSLEYLIIAMGLGFVPWLTNTFRIYLWTRFLGKRFAFAELLKIVIGSELGAAISPTAIGGGYVKVALLVHKGMSLGAATSLMTLGAVEDFSFFALSLPTALIWTSAFKMPIFSKILDRFQGFANILFWVLFGLGVMIIVIFFIKKIGIFNKIKNISLFSRIQMRVEMFLVDFTNIFRLIRRRGKWRFGLTLLLTSIQWTCRYSVITALLACFHIPLHPVKFFLLQWIVFTIGTFTPTPGGAIGTEASFYFLYRAFIPESIIGLAGAGWRFLTFYLQLCIGAILFTIINLKAIQQRNKKTLRTKKTEYDFNYSFLE